MRAPQAAQCRAQKDNSLAVLSGEATYLLEHQLTVQRKASELTTKMAELETSISAAEYKQQRVAHATELATADKRGECDALNEEMVALEARFDALREDVRVLYGDKVELLRQQEAAKAETADVEACVAQYRKRLANLADQQ